MKKVLLATVTALAALSLAACADGFIGKGKGVPPAPPPVVTKG